MKRRALICSYHPPQADRDSGSKRICDLLEILLAEGWSVTFVASQGLGEARYARRLQQRGVAVLDGTVLPLENILASSSFDLALFAFWPIAEFYLPVLLQFSPGTRVIVDSLDLHFLRDARRIFGAPGGLLDADYAAQMRGELNAYAAADAVLAVSEKEAALINDLVGDPGRAHAVHDCETIGLGACPFAQRKGIVMVAGFQHPPNVEAAGWLCREVLPRLPKALRAAHPLHLVGSGLNDTVRAFGEGLADVRMVGWVPEVAPYFHHARISVVPLLHGAGTKRKMLQALLSGTPTVTTSIGAEGLALTAGEHALIADDADAFAAAMTKLLTDQALWQRVQKGGRAHLAKTHSAEETRRRFLEVIAKILRAEPRPALLPAISAEEHQARVNYQYHQQLLPHLRALVARAVPVGAPVAVISGGHDALLALDGRPGWHFLQDESGRGIAGHPPDDLAAICRLEELRGQGAAFLLVPEPSAWWLRHFGEFRGHLESRCRQVGAVPEVGVLFHLSEPDRESTASAEILSAPVIDPERDVRLIAFYLPQFHPIPENDEWWGEGFTEWRNVVQAQPLFPGHEQPQLPADLGYYDLRAAETRADQARLARQYGIGGFCYYHYWFGGKRLLERPFSEVLASGEPDFPFCLCWANEPWSRQWDGRPHDVLQPQTYSEEDDIAHIHALLPALSDPRAIRVGARPLFLVYQGRELPDPARTIATWRREVESAGLPGIYLLAVESGWDAGWDATQVGFDAKVLFQPQFSLLRETPRSEIAGQPELHVFDYEKAWPALAHPEPVSYRRYDTVFPAWDNTARKGGRGWVVRDSTPAAYEEWLRLMVARASKLPPGERLVFVNAWNEWAEGAHLEPDQRHGRAYLEATRRAVLAAGVGAPNDRPPRKAAARRKAR